MPSNIEQLKRAVALSEQIERLQRELDQILAGIGGSAAIAPKPTSAPAPRKKGGMSAAGRARIVAAQKARWAKLKAGKTAAQPAQEPKPKAKRKISAEARAKMAAAAKARWAKIKGAAKS